MHAAPYKALRVRKDTHSLVRWAAFMSGLTVADFSDTVIRQLVLLYLQQRLLKPPQK